MDNKILGYVLFGVKALVVVLGVLFTLWVMQGGDPFKMGDQEMEQMAIKEAIDQKLDQEMNQFELDAWIAERGPQIKAELEESQFSNVSIAIDYTKWLIYLIIAIVLLSFGYLFTVDAKKALFGLIGVVGVLGFLMVVYYSVSNAVPDTLVAKEIAKEVAEEDRMFTADNWQLASAALASSGILILIASIGAVFGFFRKMFI